MVVSIVWSWITEETDDQGMPHNTPRGVLQGVPWVRNDNRLSSWCSTECVVQKTSTHAICQTTILNTLFKSIKSPNRNRKKFTHPINETRSIQNHLPPYLSNTITVLKCSGCKQQCIYRIVSVVIRFVYLANDLVGGGDLLMLLAKY